MPESASEMDIVEYTKKSKKLLMIVSTLAMVSTLICAIIPGAFFLNSHKFNDRAPKNSAFLNSTHLDSCTVGRTLTFGDDVTSVSKNFDALCPLFRYSFLIGWSLKVFVFVLLIFYNIWIYKIEQFEGPVRALVRRCGHVLVILMILGALLYSFLTMILFPFYGAFAMLFWVPPYFGLVFLDEGLDREKTSWKKREGELKQ
ncbi:hypothetical protein M3Y95_00409900 [Aphelenchoides besseyi]|nr:hypothetical protein M3Y95_00409900 [Aphelenchoides besseyi]